MEEDFYPAYYELEGRHWWFVGRRKIFLRLLERELPPAARPIELLDFGCGTGAFLEHLERFGTVNAVDGDPSAVAFCHQRGRDEVALVPPGAPLPFADDAFDLVTTLDVIEHIDDDVAALGELHRVLRPGGRLLVAVPAYMFLWGKQDEVSHHKRRYTARTLRAALEAAGFAVDRTSYFNTLLFPPIAAVRVGRRLLRRAGGAASAQSDFELGPPALNRALGALFGAEAAVVAKRGLPFGVSLLALARAPRRSAAPRG
jgi:SAM-dependent methyltransferase